MFSQCTTSHDFLCCLAFLGGLFIISAIVGYLFAEWEKKHKKKIYDQINLENTFDGHHSPE